MALSRFGRWSAARGRQLGAAIRRHPWRTALALPTLVLLYVLALIPFTPSIGDIKKAKAEQPTVVLTADGKELAVFKRANRDWVKLSEMSKNVVDALIATEDKRFYQHHGLDLKRTVKAIFLTVAGDRQGGSTLTQQLARNLYPEDIGREVSVHRKVKEAITALKIEAVYSKDEILETYLNTVPFLYNAYGIEMAARTYFDKSADKLDVLEAATLVGMLKGTSYYNPVLAPERSLERRNTVLVQMVKNGKLEQARYDELRKRPLKLDFERQTELMGMAPHLSQYLKRWLIDWADQQGYNIYADGLRLHTSIDSRLQNWAAGAVRARGEQLQKTATAAWGANGWTRNKTLAQAFARETDEYRAAREAGQSDAEALKKVMADDERMANLWKAKTEIQAGFLAIEPGSGHIKAWVGSRDFAQDQFDHVQQARRQPGSTFKPFVYGAAFEQGISPAESFVDQPVEIRIDERTVWKPGDVSDYTGRPMTLREGLIYSKNSITAQLVQRVGASSVARLARAAGVRQSKLDEVMSLALGTSPVTLREMVTGYTTIANSGNYIEPTVVTRIEDREGNVLATFGGKAPESAMSTQAAHTLLDVMRGVIDQGTGAAIRSRHGITADVAGKTGTTQSNTDGWFILMHPQLVSGAWVGFNDSRINMPGDWGQGSHSALPIVGDFYQAAFRTRVLDAKAQFAVPKGASQQQAPDMWGRVGDWISSILGNGSAPPPAEPLPMPDPAAVANLPPPRTPDVVVVQPEPTPLPEVQALPPPRMPVESVPRPQELPRDIVRAPEVVRGNELPRVLEAPPRGNEVARPYETPRASEIVRAPEPATPRALPDGGSRTPPVVGGGAQRFEIRPYQPRSSSTATGSASTGSAGTAISGAGPARSSRTEPAQEPAAPSAASGSAGSAGGTESPPSSSSGEPRAAEGSAVTQ